jgi:hypothetical protein
MNFQNQCPQMLLARVWKGEEECVCFEHEVKKEGMLGFV